MNAAQSALESRLRSLRNDPALFGDNESEVERIAAEIEDCKARLAPFWAERAAAARHARGQRLLVTYA